MEFALALERKWVLKWTRGHWDASQKPPARAWALATGQSKEALKGRPPGWAAKKRDEGKERP